MDRLDRLQSIAGAGKDGQSQAAKSPSHPLSDLPKFCQGLFTVPGSTALHHGLSLCSCSLPAEAITMKGLMSRDPRQMQHLVPG